MRHQVSTIIIPNKVEVKAVAPVIISASRATDIPAFYAEWFFRRLEAGFVKWRNPFSGKDSYVSFKNTRFIVFWSKNPKPLMSYLPQLQKRGIGCYIQFTLNDYEAEELEPNLPSIEERIGSFKQLSEILGKEAVIWRFDPLVLSDRITAEKLLNKIQAIGDQLVGYTNKLVFSFADIGSYKKVGGNLTKAGIKYREWSEVEMLQFSERLSRLNQERWNFELATCAEAIGLESCGVAHNRCIDPELIAKLSSNDESLQHFLQSVQNDSGQRSLCGCILAKDIGAYNTCPHGCIYCYANTSPHSAHNNFCKHIQHPHLDSII